MSVELTRLLLQCGFTVNGDQFIVTLPNRRMQKISFADTPSGYRLWTTVATPKAAKKVAQGAFMLLRQNRFSELVEFTIDKRGGWIAQAGLPLDAPSKSELVTYIHALAGAADRLEQIISGSDER